MINVFEPEITFKDRIEVYKALKNKNISGTSNEVRLFETSLASYFERKHAVAVSNGSVALDLALKLLNLEKDDEVILPSFTIISCLAAVIRGGGKPIFCDIDPNSWNMNLDNVKKAFTKKTKAVLMVHTYGLSAEAEEIEKFCLENNIYLIEDASEAHGQSYNGRKCGSFGDISTLSFYANKNMTSGEGGALLLNSLENSEKLKKMRNLDFNNTNRFKHKHLYWNYRLSGLQATLGRSQLNSLELNIKNKIKQARVYDKLFLDYKDLVQIPRDNFLDVMNHYWVYGIILQKNDIRDKIIDKLYEKGIETRPFFFPLHLQEIENIDLVNNVELPVTELISKNGLYIPTGSHINVKKQKFIVKTIIELLSE